MDEVINVEHLYKKFGDTMVLNDINLICEKGKIYGFIGRNGSGKTVLLKCICGLLTPSSGKVMVNSQILGDQTDIPQDVGILIESPGYLSEFSGYQNLKLLADLRREVDSAIIKEVMDKVGLDPDNKKHVKKYSMGMKQRLGIAQAIMEEPNIIILDEPMNGLDGTGVIEIRELLRELREKGHTLLIASHNMEDISLLCDFVFQLNGGVMTLYSV